MKFRYEEVVGRYRFVVSSEVLAFVERAFVDPAPPEKREAVRKEALAEAGAAELELTADGFAISRAGNQEFYRVRLPQNGEPMHELIFAKPDGSPVTLVLEEPSTIVAHQPGKPRAVFRRV
jgi:hypothetical protein